MPRSLYLTRAQAEKLARGKPLVATEPRPAPEEIGAGWAGSGAAPGSPVDTIFRPCGHRVQHPQGVRGQFTCPECGVRAKSIVTHDAREGAEE